MPLSRSQAQGIYDRASSSVKEKADASAQKSVEAVGQNGDPTVISCAYSLGVIHGHDSASQPELSDPIAVMIGEASKTYSDNETGNADRVVERRVAAATLLNALEDYQRVLKND